MRPKTAALSFLKPDYFTNAIQIFFTDGHSTGIFSYDYLRSICPCAECALAFRDPSASSAI